MPEIVETRFIPAVGALVGFDSDGKPWFQTREHLERYREWKRDQDALQALPDIPTRAEVTPGIVSDVQSPGMYSRSGWRL